jgi:hypothetical protein
MEDLIHGLNGRFDASGISHISNFNLYPIPMTGTEPSHIVFDAMARKIVKDDDKCAITCKAISKVSAYKSSAAGN